MNRVRWSTLRYMAKSPAHYQYALANPPAETSAMRVGAFVHELILNGARKFSLWNGDRRGKAWEEFRDGHADTTILNRAESDMGYGAAEAVRTSDLAMSLLEGTREEPISWTISGRECRGVPDAYGLDWVTELKVTPDASPARFPWHARRMLWDAQLAWYAAGRRIEAPALHFVAVEAKPPHVVACYSLTASAIEAATAKWRALFETLMVCEASGNWPGYCESILPFDAVEDVMLEIDGEEITL